MERPRGDRRLYRAARVITFRGRFGDDYSPANVLIARRHCLAAYLRVINVYKLRITVKVQSAHGPLRVMNYSRNPLH